MVFPVSVLTKICIVRFPVCSSRVCVCSQRAREWRRNEPLTRHDGRRSKGVAFEIKTTGGGYRPGRDWSRLGACFFSNQWDVTLSWVHVTSHYGASDRTRSVWGDGDGDGAECPNERPSSGSEGAARARARPHSRERRRRTGAFRVACKRKREREWCVCVCV